LIELQNVGKSYGPGAPAVDGVSLTIARGEFLVLVGASGSGKSTLLKLINRMESHDAGKILFDGQEIYSIPVRELRLRMGYAIQSVGLFPHWTVARNIGTVPEMLGWPAARIAERVNTLLELFGLDSAVYRGRYPHELSGGQQQRIGVARALAADPDVLLMDEPFGALDPVIRASLQAEMKRVHQASGKTIVMVTHDVDEALRLATRIVMLDRGRIVQAGTPLQLLSQPADARVADFFGRGDIGIRLLSLQPARSLARAEPNQPGPGLPADASLREAISAMAQQQRASINLLDAAGNAAGVLHAADVFSPSARS
jgi:osmoprotectant transport system ATP-binding protein